MAKRLAVTRTISVIEEVQALRTDKRRSKYTREEIMVQLDLAAGYLDGRVKTAELAKYLGVPYSAIGNWVGQTMARAYREKLLRRA